MAIKKCAYCGNIFNSFGADICANCGVDLDEAYDKLKKYIYQNPQKVDFITLAENTDVSEKAISYLIEIGRLEVRKPGKGSRCRECGAEISEGSLCVNCMHRMLTNRPSVERKANQEHKQDLKQGGKSGINPLITRQH